MSQQHNLSAEQGGRDLDAMSGRQEFPAAQRKIVVENGIANLEGIWRDYDPYHSPQDQRFNMGATATMVATDRRDSRQEVLQASPAAVRDEFEEIVAANSMQNLGRSIVSYAESPVIQQADALAVQPEPYDPYQTIGV